MFYAKKHGKILAACDKKLLGKKLVEKKTCLHVKKEFYGTSLVSKKELIEMLEKSENINVVGENAVKLAGEAVCVKRIKGVPYAIIIKG